MSLILAILFGIGGVAISSATGSPTAFGSFEATVLCAILGAIFGGIIDIRGKMDHIYRDYVSRTFPKRKESDPTQSK